MANFHESRETCRDYYCDALWSTFLLGTRLFMLGFAFFMKCQETRYDGKSCVQNTELLKPFYCQSATTGAAFQVHVYPSRTRLSLPSCCDVQAKRGQCHHPRVIGCHYCEIQTVISLENDHWQEQTLAAHNATLMAFLNNLTPWGELLQELKTGNLNVTVSLLLTLYNANGTLF
jgi:hypothetical protein